MESVTNLCLHKKRSYPSRITAFFRKRLLRLWRQLKLIAAVGDGTDRISRSHLPAELADDIDHGRAAVLRELMPYGLIDLFLREDPAGMSGQIRQREELQVRKVERLALPLYRLLAQVQLQAGKGEGVLRGGRLHDFNSRLFRQEVLDPIQNLFLAIGDG